MNKDLQEPLVLYENPVYAQGGKETGNTTPYEENYIG